MAYHWWWYTWRRCDAWKNIFRTSPKYILKIISNDKEIMADKWIRNNDKFSFLKSLMQTAQFSEQLFIHKENYNYSYQYTSVYGHIGITETFHKLRLYSLWWKFEIVIEIEISKLEQNWFQFSRIQHILENIDDNIYLG